MLESLERSSLFVVPLDRHRDRYRYHRLFRETLRAELDRLEPELVPELNRRAAAWCEANGAPEEARRYAAAAGDLDTVARLVTTHAPQAYCDGRVEALEDWLDGLDDPAPLARHPAAAAVGSWIHAVGGRAAEAEHWLDIAAQGSSRGRLPDGTPSLEPWLALLRSALCRDGADRMLADAEAAADGLARASRWRPLALCLRGVAHVLLGADAEADALLAEAAEVAAAVEAPDIELLALGERSLLAAASGHHELAEELAEQARTLDGNGRHGTPPASAVSLAACARAELRGGRWERARSHIDEATRLLPQLTHALPWCSVQTSLELARAHTALLDTTRAWTLLDHAESILRRRPALGRLAEQVRDLRAELDALRQDDARRGSMLTAAELRLLPLLTTRLSFREIGERLHVSRNTVKTQAIAVYRKLGVSSRNDAIDRAAELGLVAAATQPLTPA
jgi:LuxR family maltose regulon positive regulatory protein